MRFIIIGAGIVGLHLAKALIEKKHEVFVLDKEAFLAEHTSGRNSGVIHAGIFYQSNSFKESLCLRGNELTYPLIQELKVPYQAKGKLVTFTNEQRDKEEEFSEKLSTLKVPFEKLQKGHEYYSNLKVDSAIHVKSTGVLDAATYVKNLSLYLEHLGVQILLNCEVENFDEKEIQTSRGPLEYDFMINSAGLWSDQFAEIDALDYEIRPCRGDYYSIHQSLAELPVYPFPNPQTPGLGVHLSPDMQGGTLIGPHAEFIEDKSNYAHLANKEEFELGLKSLLKELPEKELQPGYSGNRPKLYQSGKSVYDFTFIKKENRLHLLGIESPGLTAAPAIAEYCVKLI